MKKSEGMLLKTYGYSWIKAYYRIDPESGERKRIKGHWKKTR